jgi:hypothetical protein
MDTLCIPVVNLGDSLSLVDEIDRLKQRAIDHMAFIYAAAEQTLLLDSEIQELSVSNVHHNEILAHINCSAWMGKS